MYKNYIFDLYGTLIDIRTDESKPEFWEKIADYYENHGAKYTPDELEKCFQKHVDDEKITVKKLYPEYEYIDINYENIFRDLYSEKGVNAERGMILETAEYFRTSSTMYIRLYDGVTELLQTLKEREKNVYLLTNAQRCFTYNEIEQTGLLGYFDGIIISSDVFCMKPDKNIYYFLLERYGLKKSESIMIGNDCKSDIAGAHRVGIDSLYIHQDISPKIKDKLYSKWSVMDGDFRKIKELVLKNE